MSPYDPGMTLWNPTTHDEYDMLKGIDVFARDGAKVGIFQDIYHPVEDFPTSKGRHFFLLDPGIQKNLFGTLDETIIPETKIEGFIELGIYLNITEEEIRVQAWATPDNFNEYGKS